MKLEIGPEIHQEKTEHTSILQKIPETTTDLMAVKPKTALDTQINKKAPDKTV